MEIPLVGAGPAMTAIRAALEDVAVSPVPGAVETLETAPIGVVSAPAGDAVFEQAIEHADRWIAIEIGGLGGVALPDVHAAVTGFGPETGCYRCLSRRVQATTDQPADSPSGSQAGTWLAGAVAGYELIRLLSGDDQITGHSIEIPYQRRELLPTPHCQCGSPPAATLDHDRSSTDIETTIEQAERAIDNRVGIVTDIAENESFPAPYYLATLATTKHISDGAAPTYAAGVATDWNRALMKALGEAYERYAAATYRRDQLIEASPAALDNAILPAAFVGATVSDTSEQCPQWVPGEAVQTGEEVYLPASAVYFPPPDSDAMHAITTGLAAGTTVSEAVLAGLLEIVERDAAMIEWYATGTAPRVTVDYDRFTRLRERATSVGLSVTPKLLTRDVDVPVVGVAVHRDQWPQLALGTAAALDAAIAASQALEEALQNWMELRSTTPEEAKQLDGAIGRYAANPPVEATATDGAVPAKRCSRTSESSTEMALTTVVEAVTKQGLTPYATRLTTRDLATIGIEVVRVLVPKAQPLFTDTPVFGERAQTVPPTFGERPRLERSHHPYP